MTGRPATDHTGQRFGRWLVLARAESIAKHTMWLCRCDCGVERPVRAGNLRQGVSTRCLTCANTARVRYLTRGWPRGRQPAPAACCVGPTDWSRLGGDALDLAEAGVSRREIALRLGLSKSAVAGWLYRNRDLIGWRPRADVLLPHEVPRHLRLWQVAA